MKKRIVAAAVSLSMLAGASTAIGAETSAESTSAEKATAAAVQVPTRGAVALRTVSRCRFEGTPTRCVVDITRLRLSGDGRHVVAVGTVTPRLPNAPSITFRRQVRGADVPAGPFGEGIALQQPFPSCDIVSLVLGPLHLDVLGLVIDLNRVVLTIVGQTGPGNLLGNLLCALTGILDDGLVLRRFLAVLTNLLQALNALLRL